MAFVQAPDSPPILLANARELYQLSVVGKRISLERLPDAASPTGHHWSEGVTAGGFSYLIGSVGESNQLVTWVKKSPLSSPDGWQKLADAFVWPFCNRSTCWSATGRVLATANGLVEWDTPRGLSTWENAARECAGAAATVKVTALGGAANEQEFAIVFRVGAPNAQALLVSTRYGTVDFPFSEDASPVTIAMTRDGSILAIGNGVYRLADSGWRRIGPY